jgi:hypothetical protein
MFLLWWKALSGSPQPAARRRNAAQPHHASPTRIAYGSPNTANRALHHDHGNSHARIHAQAAVSAHGADQTTLRRLRTLKARTMSETPDISAQIPENTRSV